MIKKDKKEKKEIMDVSSLKFTNNSNLIIPQVRKVKIIPIIINAPVIRTTFSTKILA